MEINYLKVLEMYPAIQGEGILVGRPSTFIRLAGCSVMCSWCLIGSTSIAIAGGPDKPIRDVEVGDRVFAYDEGSGEVVVRRVTRLYHRQVARQEMVRLGLEKSNSLTITKNHEVFIKGGWVPAGEIRVGDEIEHISPSARQSTFNTAHLRSEEAREKLRESARERMSRPKTESHRLNLSLSKTGPKNPNWTGGKTRENVPYLVRKSVLSNQGGICKICGSTERASVHHINFDPSDHRPENLTVLCKSCNTRLGPGNQQWQREISFSLKNGYRVLRVEEISPKMSARLSGSSEGLIDVYNLEVEDVHNYFANGCLVHNCDTKYSWKQAQGEILTPEEVYTRAKGMTTHGHVVLTGGEPLEHPEASLVEVIRLLQTQFHVTVESSGTAVNPRSFVPKLRTSPMLWSISPKLSSASARTPFPDLSLWIESTRLVGHSLQLKFVVTGVEDVMEVSSRLDELGGLPESTEVILQTATPPTAQPQEAILSSLKDLQEAVVQTRLFTQVSKLRVLPQLHALIWGQRRGI